MIYYIYLYMHTQESVQQHCHLVFYQDHFQQENLVTMTPKTSTQGCTQ